jgi:hypothetical protein
MRSIGSPDGRNPYSSAHSGLELDPPPQRLKALIEGAAFGIAKAMP